MNGAAHARSVPRVGHPPREDDVRRQVARITSSTVFRGSLRLTRFLTFVVEATLAGRAATLKAYTIAVEALGRDTSFDPQTDAIVRVEAGRLRQALARYYAGEGRHDRIVFELPRGSYVPIFRRREAAPTDADEALLSDALVQLIDLCRRIPNLLGSRLDVVEHAHERRPKTRSTLTR